MAGEFVQTGDELPGVELHDLDGGKQSLRNYIGNGLLVFMWATW